MALLIPREHPVPVRLSEREHHPLQPWQVLLVYQVSEFDPDVREVLMFCRADNAAKAAQMCRELWQEKIKTQKYPKTAKYPEMDDWHECHTMDLQDYTLHWQEAKRQKVHFSLTWQECRSYQPRGLLNPVLPAAFASYPDAKHDREAVG